MPPQRPFDPNSPFAAAMLATQDAPSEDEINATTGRILDDQTAGRRGVTPQSPTTAAPSAGFTGGRYDTVNMHPFAPQYPLEQRVSQEQAEYKRMTTPPPPASFKDRLLRGLGGAVYGAAAGPQGVQEALTRRDQAKARQQAERESLSNRISQDTRQLSTEGVTEEGQNLRARMAAQAQIAAAQKLGETITGQNYRNQAAIQGRSDVAGQRNTGAMDRQDSEDAARMQRQQAEDTARMARVQAQGQMRLKLQQAGVTAQSRAMGEMASSVLEQIPTILGEVDQLQSKLGPGAGRWNELWVNRVGMNDPDFAQLDQDLDLFASALVRTHFGARGGQQYRAELRKRLGEAQSPDDLKARIASADRWLEGYAKMGKGQTGAPGPTLPQRTGVSSILDKVVPPP